MKKEMLATLKTRATVEGLIPAFDCHAPSAVEKFSSPHPLCLTRFEFADALRVSVRTVDRMIAAGEIRVRRIRGKAVRILRSDAERYLERAEG
jgi:excisionase family DNA binding protein